MIKAFIFWRLGLFLITFIGSYTVPHVANSAMGSIGSAGGFNYWASWAQWDGGYYLSIAQNGYSNTENFAFFPIYPMLIRFFAPLIGGNYIAAALIISNTAFLLFLIFFAKYLKRYYSEKTVYSTLFTFLLFPTTFFAVAAYSESMFLLFVILVFLNLRDKKYL